ncbi:TRAP transporter substrate-binding protein DctP [Oscillatoria sp. CS-180]|uniref:TRAP transporter substrate-binding protein n=1 Tax=Oscillatoria sp. CS-180 TaxID=3021720 RepID=UPI00232D565B|nr:TRAP transporter substrate-binding protein DctP [Oscillatoria sp. CS-180]MDB9527519.1 TRAP transporter substrate-binding protein DctP [Oscillatoria sp. CS-180]
MKRRHLFEQIAVGGMAGALTACSYPPELTSEPERSQPVVNWRMATSWPRFLDVFEGLDILCQRVSEMTSGRFTITPYEGGELAPPLGVFDAVAAGEVPCAHTALYYFVDKDPALAFGASIPFGFDTQQQHAWLYSGGGIANIQKLLDPFGLVWLPAGNTTGQMGGWFRQPINTVADLAGLKMRIPGLGGQVLSRLGVATTPLAAQNIVPALLDGTIDAVEWIGPREDRTLGLQNAAAYYYYPGWWEPATTFALLINQQQWANLPPAYQTVLKTASAAANLAMVARYNARNREILERFRLGGTTTLPFSDEILATVRQTAFDMYEEFAADDRTFDTLYRQWLDFRQNLYAWNRVSSLSLAQFAFNTV